MGERVGTSVQDAVAGLLSDYQLQGRRLTAETYGYRLRALTRVHDGQLADLTPADMRALLTARPDLSDASILTLYAALAALFRWAIAQGMIAVSPLAGIAKPKQRRPPHRYLSVEQLRACYQACSCDAERAVFLLCGGIGLRSAEARGLKWADVDFSTNRIRVFGKGSKWRMLALDPLTASVLDRLPRDTAYVLPFRSQSGMIYRVKMAAKRAGVARITTHQLRHSFAVAYYRTTGDAFTLQSLLGHSSAAMTGYYVRDVREEEAVKRQADVDLSGMLFGE